jgi:hypothetical protein
MRYFFAILSLSSLFLAGCTTIQPEAHLLSPADIQPGTSYEIGMYVLARGDSIASVCRKFQIRIPDFESLNPGLDPRHLEIGQQVKIYERLKH